MMSKLLGKYFMTLLLFLSSYISFFYYYFYLTYFPEYWLEVLVEKRDWFMKTSGQATDEAKRPPDSSDAYGVEGTFRSLGFD